jgi:hypothetical protein
MTDLATSRNLIQVLMQRFETEHLDRVLALRDSVAAGQPLSDTDQAFLEDVFREAMDSKPFVDRFPEYQPLYARVVHLYHDITSQALANEQRPSDRRD